MRRRSLAVALVLTLALLAGPAPDGAAAGPYDFAVGGGTDYRGIHYAFAAHQNSPAPPSGHVVVRNVGQFGDPGAARIQGPVVCLDVELNDAVIGFQITKTTDPMTFPVGSYAALWVIDGGEPSDVPLYDFMGVFPRASAATACIPNQTNSLISGNVVVRDALTALLPAPALTDNATYRIDEQYNVYTMTANGWELVR